MLQDTVHSLKGWTLYHALQRLLAGRHSLHDNDQVARRWNPQSAGQSQKASTGKTRQLGLDLLKCSATQHACVDSGELHGATPALGMCIIGAHSTLQSRLRYGTGPPRSYTNFACADRGEKDCRVEVELSKLCSSLSCIADRACTTSASTPCQRLVKWSTAVDKAGVRFAVGRRVASLFMQASMRSTAACEQSWGALHTYLDSVS